MKFNLFNYTITIKKKKQRKKKINLKPKVWIPPTSIDAPSPPRGYVHRWIRACLLYTSPSPRDQRGSRMPSSA